MISFACVGLIFGQARHSWPIGCSAFGLEVAVLEALLPSRCHRWLIAGIVPGVFLGLLALFVLFEMTRLDSRQRVPLRPIRDEELLRAIDAPDANQVGALLGGTVGLYLGRLRSRRRSGPGDLG